MTDRVWSSEHKLLLSGIFKIHSAQLFLSGFFLVLGVALLFVPTKRGQEELGRYTTGAIIAASLGSLTSVFRSLLKSVKEVRVDESGLSWRTLRRFETRSWEEVVEVYRSEKHVLMQGSRPSDWNRRSDLRVIFDDGREVHFNHGLSRYNDLAASIQLVTTEHLISGALEDLADSGVGFGPVRVDEVGIVVEGDPIPWQRLRGISIGNGSIHFFEGPYRYRSVALERIPNDRLLLAILEIQGVQFVHQIPA